MADQEDEFSKLHRGLSELLGHFRQLSSGQLQGLCQLVNPRTNTALDFRLLDSLMKQPFKEFQALVQFADQHFDGLQATGDFSQADLHDKDERAHFALFYRLFLFKRLLESVKSFDLLLKIADLIPADKSQYEQLCILGELRLNLNQIPERQMKEVQKQMSEISKYEPGTEAEVLPELIKLNGSFHFFESLRLILMWPIDDILLLSQIFPSLNYIQMLLLTRFKELPPHDLWDIVGLVSPASLVPPVQQEVVSPFAQVPQAHQQVGAEQGPVVIITEQPPERCIYKRNVKPAPVVMVEGHNNMNDGSLYLAPVLVRCDNMEEVTKLMSGNEPVKVLATKTLSFKKLKITQTSHQLNETLFSLRFELRKYFGNPDSGNYQVLNHVTTNPFAVCSHSTQLKTRPKNLPTIIEVIPQFGSPNGGTKVAILGTNFEESPTARVKFDEVEIRPTFHGPKTLIVHTPKHAAGPVKVMICNEPNQWSTSIGIYTFAETTDATTTSVPVNFSPNYGAASLPFDSVLGSLEDGFILGDSNELHNFDNFATNKH